MPDRLDQLLALWDEHGSMAAYAQLKRFITEDKIKAAERCAMCGGKMDGSAPFCSGGCDACVHSWAKIGGEWRCRRCPETSVVNPLF